MGERGGAGRVFLSCRRGLRSRFRLREERVQHHHHRRLQREGGGEAGRGEPASWEGERRKPFCGRATAAAVVV